MAQEVREEWRDEARSLSQSMIEDCTYWISRLQPQKRGLTPEECFNLWSSLGQLRFEHWSKTLPPDEADAINLASKKMEDQLAEAIIRHTLPQASRSVLLAPLERGMTKIVEEMQHRIGEAKRLLNKKQLAESWDQTEFDYYIQDPMDKLAYTMELVKSLKLSLSPQMMRTLVLIQKNLGSVFLEAVRQYRKTGHHPIDAGRPVWPPSFWWRQTLE